MVVSLLILPSLFTSLLFIPPRFSLSTRPSRSPATGRWSTTASALRTSTTRLRIRVLTLISANLVFVRWSIFSLQGISASNPTITTTTPTPTSPLTIAISASLSICSNSLLCFLGVSFTSLSMASADIITHCGQCNFAMCSVRPTCTFDRHMLSWDTSLWVFSFLVLMLRSVFATIRLSSTFVSFLISWWIILMLSFAWIGIRWPVMTSGRVPLFISFWFAARSWRRIRNYSNFISQCFRGHGRAWFGLFSFLYPRIFFSKRWLFGLSLCLSLFCRACHSTTLDMQLRMLHNLEKGQVLC